MQMCPLRHSKNIPLGVVFFEIASMHKQPTETALSVNTLTSLFFLLSRVDKCTQ